MLEKLVQAGARNRLLPAPPCSEHPRSNAKTLQKLGRHPYGAIRENVARLPTLTATTAHLFEQDRSQPLWYLVAFNPNTPSVLQRRLRERLKRLGENSQRIR